MPSAKERAVTLAAKKLRSAAELKKKLLAEEYAEEDVDAAIVRLKEIYLLDDQKLAQSVSRHYKDRGNRFITQKMKQKGITVDDHSAALLELPEELERAMAAGEKKMKSLAGIESRAAASKLYQHLALRGFGGSVIQKVVRQLTGKSTED